MVTLYVIRHWLDYLQIVFSRSFICLFILLIYEYWLNVTNLTVMVQRLEIIYLAIDMYTEERGEFTQQFFTCSACNFFNFHTR